MVLGRDELNPVILPPWSDEASSPQLSSLVLTAPLAEATFNTNTLRRARKMADTDLEEVRYISVPLL